MRRISDKILLVIISMVTAAVLLVGGAALFLSARNTDSILRQTMMETAEVTADRVVYELQSYLNVAVETGYIEALSDTTVTNSAKQEILDERVSRYGFQQGNLVGADGYSRLDGIYYGDRDYFVKAMSGQATVSDMLTNRRDGNAAVFIAAPLWKEQNGEMSVAGIVCFVPQMDFLDKIMDSISISDHSEAVMWNKNGAPLTGSTARREDSSSLQMDSAMLELVNTQRVLSEEENGYGTYRSGGKARFLAYTLVPGTNNWTLGITADKSDFMKTQELSVIVMVIIIILALIGSAGVARLVTVGISKPIVACAERIQKLAEGDLTSTVPHIETKDEVREIANATQLIVHSMNQLVEKISVKLQAVASGDLTKREHMELIGDYKPLQTGMEDIMTELNDMIRNINTSSAQLSTGAEQIAEGAQNLSEGSVEQAAAVEELSATLTEILNQTKMTAENTKNAGNLVHDAKNYIDIGNVYMEAIRQNMGEIRVAADEIVKITGMIDQIASKTKILAINASIEAAGSNQEQKGFQVIAGEIGNLAQQCSAASKETARLISHTIAEIKKGNETTTDMVDVFAQIETASRQVVGLVEEATEATASQSVAVGMVAEGLSQISQVTQGNSATSEENARAGEELYSQAQKLHEMVGKFQLEDEE